jgi:hypothetical protein
MTRSSRTTTFAGAFALIAAAATPPLALPLTAAHAQAYSPMPPACAAASSQVQAQNAQTPGPPPGASTVTQMQHILYMTGLLLDALDNNCRDWADYARSREQFQTTYDSTVHTCQQVASNPADCHRQAYGH